MRSTPVLVLLALAATPAFAQPADPGEAAYQEGRRLYDLQEWDHAIAKFKEAYQLRSDAASLFNIAQSYRLKGDCLAAEGFYKTYKRNFPTAPNIEKVDKFIADLEPCAVAAAASEPKPEPARPVIEPAKPEPVKPVVTPPLATLDENRGHGTRLAGIITGAAGLVMLGVGTVYGLHARSKANDVSNGAGTWNPTLEADGNRDSSHAEIAFVIGGAALVTGSVLYYLGHRRSAETGLSLVPRRDGGMMVWACDL